jgi:hypothetical protein
MVSITISVILLGGVFYFMSDTILGISRSSSQANFLKHFYSFTTILDTWDLEILYDYSDEWFDVAILRSPDGQSWVLIWITDKDTLKLSPVMRANIYHNSVLWYRALSSTEISAVDADSSIVYDYEFFPDTLFDTFNLRNFQLESFNSWSTVEMRLDIFPFFNSNFDGQDWNWLPQDEIFTYSLVF